MHRTVVKRRWTIQGAAMWPGRAWREGVGAFSIPSIFPSILFTFRLGFAGFLRNDMTGTPEQNARRDIDANLEAAGWLVQSRSELDLPAE